MIKQVKFWIFLIIFFIVGCKKPSTTNNNTFTPLSYLPVYPGSYWKYYIGNDTIISRTSDTLTWFMGAYSSILDGNIIRNYDKWVSYGIYNTGWRHILSEIVGEQFSELLGDPRMYPGRIEYIVLQKKKDSKGDSVIIQKYRRWSGGPSPEPYGYWVYQIYKKEVGLYFECGIDTVTKDTNYKKILFNFFVNRNWKP